MRWLVPLLAEFSRATSAFQGVLQSCPVPDIMPPLDGSTVNITGTRLSDQIPSPYWTHNKAVTLSGPKWKCDGLL
jgi:hypothetical protein